MSARGKQAGQEASGGWKGVRSSSARCPVAFLGAEVKREICSARKGASVNSLVSLAPGELHWAAVTAKDAQGLPLRLRYPLSLTQ